MSRCRNCGAEVAEVLCPSCGALVVKSADEIACENHPGEPAVACCVVCGKPVCGDCTTSSDGVFVCDLPEHHRIAATWVPLTLAMDAFEADMVKTNLVQAGIPIRVADPRNFAGTLWFRPHLGVRILVERATWELAKNVIGSFQLPDIES